MKVKVGANNPYTAVFNATAKTLVFSGFYNADLSLENIFSIYNTTRSAYMYKGTATATATLTESITTGVPVYTLTLSAVPGSSADADALIILVNIPDDVAIYNAITQVATNTIPA